jgi:hypothetical protein
MIFNNIIFAVMYNANDQINNIKTGNRIWIVKGSGFDRDLDLESELDPD